MKTAIFIQMVPFFLLSCSTISRHENDYIAIEKQQIELYAAQDPDFLDVSRDLKRFKSQLIPLLAKYFSRSDALVIREALNTKGAFNISPVFHNFHGSWTGFWEEQSRPLEKYHHEWSVPYRKGEVVIQKVWIYQNENESTPIAAINSSSQGKIFGGVGRVAGKNRTHAPHLGFYVDELSLVWVARFGQGDFPYYSLYFERINPNSAPVRYEINGFGFSYNRKENKILKPHWKKGLYLKQ